MQPFVFQMMLWQQGMQMMRACMTAQTEFNIRLIEAMAGGMAPRSAAQLARDAEAMRRTDAAAARTRKPDRPSRESAKPRGGGAKSAKATAPRSGAATEGVRVH